jgi:hypothetical protein
MPHSSIIFYIFSLFTSHKDGVKHGRPTAISFRFLNSDKILPLLPRT